MVKYYECKTSQPGHNFAGLVKISTANFRQYVQTLASIDEGIDEGIITA